MTSWQSSSHYSPKIRTAAFQTHLLYCVFVYMLWSQASYKKCDVKPKTNQQLASDNFFSLNSKLYDLSVESSDKRFFCVFSGLARDCHNLFIQGQRASGIYTIQPEGSQPFNVLCEMTSGESDRFQTSVRKVYWFDYEITQAEQGKFLSKTRPA